MNVKPIVLKEHEVRAILDGRKSQLRRVVTGNARKMLTCTDPDIIAKHTPLYEIGTRLWVREPFVYPDVYKADTPREDLHKYKWRPQTWMTRGMSRLTLVVKDIRIERLREITESNARAEGIRSPLRYVGAQRDDFAAMWDLYTKKGYRWVDNPWVWVIEFEKEAEG